MPGMTTVTWMSGYVVRRSMRRLELSELSAALAALYADRCVAMGTRPRNDETLMTWPRPPRSMKCWTATCMP